MARFLWIDDDKDRRSKAKHLGEALQVQVDFHCLGREYQTTLEPILQGVEPLLIIIDQNLANLFGILKKGSSLAGIFRDVWPNCPIICVTSQDFDFFNQYQAAMFDGIYSAEKISDAYDEMSILSNSYTKINSTKIRKDEPTYIGKVIGLLDAPEDDIEWLSAIVPPFVRFDSKSNLVVSKLSDWIRKVLIRRPGFLYNEMHVSNLLGLSTQGFHKVKSCFNEAKYTGVFANEFGERWWKSSVLSILYTLTESNALPIIAGRSLPGLKEALDFSVCYHSNEPYPEVVAFVDQGLDLREEAFKAKYTILNPDYDRILFFDDIRLFTPNN